MAKQSKDKKRPVGECLICGEIKELSFEHVPPQKAFNNHPVFYEAVEDYLFGEAGYRRDRQNKGIGNFTLCDLCNNNTGSWYGGHFIEWCKAGMQHLGRTGGDNSHIYVDTVRPLAIIKQIVTMFFSVNPHLHKKYPELVQFVLDRERMYLSPEFGFYTYLHIKGISRFSPVVGVLKAASGRSQLISEFSFPPYGYVMTINGPPHERRLMNITDCSRYSYDEIAKIVVHMPLLETHTPMPGDYRTKEQVIADAGGIDSDVSP